MPCDSAPLSCTRTVGPTDSGPCSPGKPVQKVARNDLPLTRPGTGERRSGRADVVRHEHSAAGEAQHQPDLVGRAVVLTYAHPAAEQPVVVARYRRRSCRQPRDRHTTRGDSCTPQRLAAPHCVLTHRSPSPEIRCSSSCTRDDAVTTVRPARRRGVAPRLLAVLLVGHSVRLHARGFAARLPPYWPILEATDRSPEDVACESLSSIPVRWARSSPRSWSPQAMRCTGCRRAAARLPWRARTRPG